MYPLLLIAQEAKPILDAWEYNVSESNNFNYYEDQSFYYEMAERLISFYQTKISTGSISRCPFVISCSSFCKKALKEHFVWGLLLFIDRYFYRENIDAFSHYNLIQTNTGVLKLEDGLFLSGQ